MKEQIFGIQSNYGDASLRFYHISLSPVADASEKGHTHAYYELLFCIDGSFSYAVEGKKVQICKIREQERAL